MYFSGRWLQCGQVYAYCFKRLRRTRGRGLVIYLVPRMLSYIKSCYTRSSTAVHHRISACLPTLPTFQVAEDFALFAATASSSLRFTAPLLATEHFKLLALRCWTACHRRLRRHRPHSTLDVSVHRIISWHSAGLTLCVSIHTVCNGPSSVLHA